jgi:hypothetical protein
MELFAFGTERTQILGFLNPLLAIVGQSTLCVWLMVMFLVLEATEKYLCGIFQLEKSFGHLLGIRAGSRASNCQRMGR